ncbi:MAG TPA: protein kinase [Pyrinomonadaceae bacterium]|jgi:non-specific serine/threonine protein kinase
MDPETYQRIQVLLQSALAHEPDKRSAFLDQACEGDESLRSQVASLLISSERAGDFLESPAVEIAAQLVTDHQAKLTKGQALGNYTVVSHLGSGGMGEIYLAEDTRLNRKVALKLLPSFLTKHGERLRRFEQEARAVSAVNHPNILTIYEVCRFDSVDFIVSEFIDGETLRRIMTRGPMSVLDALGVGAQVCAALAAVHEAGVIHRDIKPENIMIRRDGYVKVLDFGIAKLNQLSEKTDLDAATKVKTNPGMMLGTVSYMSPEQARGQDVDARADIWSLGVVLYEMVSGRVPFEGATISHVLVSIQDQAPAPLAQPPGEFADKFERIVLKTLAKDKTERYQTASELFQDLKKLEKEIEFKSELERVSQLQRGSEFRQSLASLASPAPASSSSSPNNLPIQLTSVIGRKAEVAAIKKQLTRDGVRLLTLTGPGGTGKTRLSLQVGAELLDKFTGGVMFVPLAAIVDPNLVASTIAQALGIKEAGGKSLLQSLKEFLRERQMLLVIDNFEQIVTSAPLISELLNASPQLKCLITSREPLRVGGEHEFPVLPLSVPARGQSLSLDVVVQYPAVELFLDRASAVKPDFALTPENAEAVVEICSKLDGLPLAIELAAARIKVLPPRALLARLENRLKLLSGGARDLPSRQQTMRGAIAWSYDLLDEKERKLFRRLSVFVAGCDLQAIEEVCNRFADLEIDALDGVSSLIDKSLLQQRETAGADSRFTMLETITEFGLEQLAASGEADQLCKSHAAFFLKLAEQGETELLGTQQEMWLDKFELEHGNFRAATQWAEQNRQPETALRLAGAMWRFWEMRGYLAEGREVLRRLLALEETAETMKPRLKALYAAGILADSQCDYLAARGLFDQKLALHRQLGDKWGVANSINNLGIIALRQHDYVGARTLYEESLELWRELGNQRAVALALGNLGNVADLTGDFDLAYAHYNESLELFKTLQDNRGVALSLHHLGDVARHQGDHGRARPFYDQSLRLLTELGEKRAMAHLFSDMGNLAGERGDYDEARHLHEESMVIFSELGDVRGIANLFDSSAKIATSQGRLERALRLSSAGTKLREDFSAHLPPDDQAQLQQAITVIRQKLGEAASEIAWQEGRAMPTEKAIQYALASDTV